MGTRHVFLKHISQTSHSIVGTAQNTALWYVPFHLIMSKDALCSKTVQVYTHSPFMINVRFSKLTIHIHSNDSTLLFYHRSLSIVMKFPVEGVGMRCIFKGSNFEVTHVVLPQA